MDVTINKKLLRKQEMAQIRLPRETINRLEIIKKNGGFKSHRQVVEYLIMLQFLVINSIPKGRTLQDWLEKHEIKAAGHGVLFPILFDDFDRAAAFLCSDLASGISGEVLYVDGGFNTTAMGSLPD